MTSVSSLIRKRVTVCEYPDGTVEIQHEGTSRVFDKIRQVNQAAVVDNKQLDAALEMSWCDARSH